MRGGSVYLGRGETQLAIKKSDPEVSHSNSLLGDIQACLQDAQLRITDIEVLACASGPGSFTGLRIGIATLKGLADSLRLPCVGIQTLHALAHAAGRSHATVALIPAGRGEVFAQLLSVSADDEVIEIDNASHLTSDGLLQRYAGVANLTWTSIGCETQVAAIKDYATDHQIAFGGVLTDFRSNGNNAEGWRHIEVKTSLAINVAALALKRFTSGSMDSSQSLTAIYVRPSDAELKQWR